MKLEKLLGAIDFHCNPEITFYDEHGDILNPWNADQTKRLCRIDDLPFRFVYYYSKSVVLFRISDDGIVVRIVRFIAPKSIAFLC